MRVGRNLSRACIVAVTILDPGLRISEALGIRKEDVDFDNLVIRVKGKGSKHRLVPISNELRKRLFNYFKRVGINNQSDLAFGTKYGTQITARNFLRDFRRLCSQLSIVDVRTSPHTLRHTFAVSYLRAGGNLFYLSRILGHTSTKTTERYLQSFGIEDLQAVHNKLSLLTK